MRHAAVLLLLCCCLPARVVTSEGAERRYYSTFDGYGFPLVVREKHRLTPEEAQGREAYVVVTVDHDGRISTLEKMLRGTRQFAHSYGYDSRGRVVEVREESGDKVTVMRRTGDGRFERVRAAVGD